MNRKLQGTEKMRKVKMNSKGRKEKLKNKNKERKEKAMRESDLKTHLSRIIGKKGNLRGREMVCREKNA